MSPYGLSFGDYKTYQLRKYYRTWIERTLQTASELPPNTRDQLRILHFKDCMGVLKIEDPGRLPCAELQKGESGKMSVSKDKLACLLTMIRNLIQTWWKCGKEQPGQVESLLTELDYVIEEWEREIIVYGDPKEGYRLGMEAV